MDRGRPADRSARRARSHPVGWELDAIERRGHIAKLAVMMPPAVTGFGRLFLSLLPVKLAMQGLAALGIVHDHSAPVRCDLQQRWDVLRHAVAKVQAFAALPEQAPEELQMVHLGRDGVPTLLIGGERSDEADYEQAVRLAIYGIHCHA